MCFFFFFDLALFVVVVAVVDDDDDDDEEEEEEFLIEIFIFLGTAESFPVVVVDELVVDPVFLSEPRE